MLHILGLLTFMVNHKQAKLQCNIFTVCFQVKHCPVTFVTQTSHGVTVIAQAINIIVILHLVKLASRQLEEGFRGNVPDFTATI